MASIPKVTVPYCILFPENIYLASGMDIPLKAQIWNTAFPEETHLEVINQENIKHKKPSLDRASLFKDGI